MKNLVSAGDFFSNGFLKLIAPMFIAFPSATKELFKPKNLKKNAPYIVIVGFLVFFWNQIRTKNMNDGTVDEVADKIATELGTHKKFWALDPRTWSEDEEEALELMEGNKSRLKRIIEIYNEISKSGSLLEDVKKLFSEEQLKRFNELF